MRIASTLQVGRFEREIITVKAKVRSFRKDVITYLTS